VQSPSAQVVEYPSGRAAHDLSAGTELFDLTPHGRPPYTGTIDNPDWALMRHLGRHLQRQLTRGRSTMACTDFWVGSTILSQRNSEGRRLARTGA